MMTTSKILIIDGTGESSSYAAKTLMTNEAVIITSCHPDQAENLMTSGRPDLVIADCTGDQNPVQWVKKAESLQLPAQVIAVTAEPDFRRSMAWVADGLYNVLAKPVDEKELDRVVKAALASRDTFDSLTKSASASALASELAEFYLGLSGILNGNELKSYIIKHVKKLTGALKVDLWLSTDFSDMAYNIDEDCKSQKISRPKSPDNTVISEQVCSCRLAYDLCVAGRHLGVMYLGFNKEAEMRIRRQEVVEELIQAISAAFNAARRYHKAINLAACDGLTGLYNRRIFNEVFKREFAAAKRHDHSLSLLVLDLDHFKSVNDTHGHQIGDLVLKTVADVISKAVRGTDLPARIGGEEFAIILPHTTQEQAVILAERIKNRLAEIEFNINGAIFQQTISQGITGLEHFMVKTTDDMLYWCDKAMYLAKSEGRDTIRRASDLPMTPMMKDGAYAFQ